MGLLRAGAGALGGTLADQWKEFFYCDSISKDVLCVKGQKRITSRSSNTRGNDNIISNGSGIAVADGQCMIIVEQGKVVEICAEPGEFTWNSSTEPSLFTGKLGESIKQSFATLGKRFTYGGDTGKDQRVYYFNTKEIIDNKFGTANPIPFRIVDKNIGLDYDTSVRCNGVYSYKIADPIIFYTNVCGNVEREYGRSEIESQLKTEFVSALQPAFARISELEIRPNALPAHSEELSQFMNEALTQKWYEKRGLKVVSIAMNPLTLPEEDLAEIQEIQKAATMRRPDMYAAQMGSAQADALRKAAANENGAMTGFMGMGMAMNSMGQNNAVFMDTLNKQAAQNAPAADGWKCECGAVNTGKFCAECGKPKPEDGWKCSCGAVNKGKFCAECGKPRPEGAGTFRCNKCGWVPEDPKNPPKFCPECGDPFDENDKA